MSRIARVVVPGIPHHITQRGNGRQAVFVGDDEQHLYLDLLRGYAQKYALRTWAYCLMGNHVHLIAVPERDDSLARTLGRTHSDYARYLNVRRRSCGHLWEARFFSCPLDGQHVWAAMLYVERNPVRAGLVTDPEHWRWSSAQAHLSGKDPDKLLDLSGWSTIYDSARWRIALRTSLEEEAWQRRLQEATIQGRPMGSQEFVDNLEQILNRVLRPKPAGRPRKVKSPVPPSAATEQLALEIGV